MVKKYTIKKGNHYSSPPHLHLHLGITKLKFKFKFSSECVFPLVSAEDYAINKLYGFSQMFHHKNSVRIGWTPSEKEVGRIDLFHYCYNKGKRITGLIIAVDTEKWHEATIEIDALFRLATFTIKDMESNLTVSASSIAYECPKFKWGYKLYPFFGGKNTAPRDMTFWIEDIY